MRFAITLISLLCALSFAQSQNAAYWTEVEASRVLLPAGSEITVAASRYRTLRLDYEGFKNILRQAPLEFTPEAASQPVHLALPMPEGGLHWFRAVESPVMAPELAARYPGIKSFQAYSLEDPLVSARFDYSVNGLIVSILTPKGRVLIEPYATKQTAFYISYYSRDLLADELPGFACGYEASIEDELAHEAMLQASETAINFRNNELVPLRTYRLALACTGEYAQQKGGTLEAVQATFNTSVNLINQIFQVENAVRMELIPANDLLIFLDPDTDPYQNANSGTNLLGQNTAVINSIIPFSAYDLGHVFTSGCNDVGGVAGGTICSPNKARGVTCHYTNNLTLIVNRVLAHEIGHQFSVGHSWSNCPGSEGQLASGSAFEPGSGSTIMSYQGSCGSQNNISGPAGVYFNIGSVETFIFFARQGGGSTCGETSMPGNQMPTVTLPYENGFHIPISTPFELTAEASDPDGDDLTYCWEQYDLGPTTNLGSPILDAPIFRSFNPTSSPTRVFPRLNKIIANNFDNEEVLPTYTRNLTFRCVVRDNDPVAGGTVWEEVRFRSDETAGPFRVLHPNVDTIRWRVGEYQEVRWDVANTDNNRVKCYYVNIKLSVDGGNTYPYTLLANAPNTGSAFVNVPEVQTSAARIRIEAAGNIFFDLSDRNFSIDEPIEPGFALAAQPAAIPLYCLPGEGALRFDIQTASLLGYDSLVSLSLLGELPGSASYAFEQEQLLPGEQTTLSIDLGGFIGRDTLLLQIQAVAPGLDTAYRNLYVVALSSDFSELSLQEPADGTSGIVFSTDFDWAPSSSADAYDFELATSPAFGSATLASTSGLEQTAFTPSILLDPNELYYWRVRPVNDCGPGEWLDPFAFQTATVDCQNNAATDLPISLANSVNTKISRVFVPISGIINDLNIKNLVVSFQPVNSLRITLISPAGTEAILYNRNCLNTGLVRLNFDDEAPNGILCPPSNNAFARPAESLSIFDGEDTFGEWTLRVQVVASGFGGGGSIQSWSLEFCAARTPNPPSLLRNELFRVPPGQGNTITEDFLEAQNDQIAPEQMRYTLVRPPAHGQLFRWAQSEPLLAGAKFSQATINAFNLVYVHDGSDTQTDSFTFVVEDGTGGWIPTQTFQIAIDPDAVVSTRDLADDNKMTLFPNPARDMVTIAFQQPPSSLAEVRFINMQGQQVQQSRLAAGENNLPVSTANLPAGIYFVQVHSADGYFLQKLVVQR
jgi:subtilisin-like proprotein convertase family protein